MRSIFFIMVFIPALNFVAAQSLKIKLSNPQPRLGDTIVLIIDTKQLHTELFNSIRNNSQVSSDDIYPSHENKMEYKVGATKLGKHQIGPLQFTFNGVSYSSNQIEYEVIDSLKRADQGLWIRKVITGDSTFSIIIDQRMPNMSKNTYNPNHSPCANLICNNLAYGIISIGYSSDTEVPDESDFKKGNTILINQFIYNFKIIDKKAKIEFYRTDFEGLPIDFKFEKIIIQ